MLLNKIKLIFDLHKNENGLFVKSPELDEYLLCSFIISYYCIVSARKKIANSYPNIEQLTNETLMKMVSISELKDSQNLVNTFNNTFFNKEALTWEEYRQKFENPDGFQWILSSKGIRKNLEDHNI